MTFRLWRCFFFSLEVGDAVIELVDILDPLLTIVAILLRSHHHHVVRVRVGGGVLELFDNVNSRSTIELEIIVVPS